MNSILLDQNDIYIGSITHVMLKRGENLVNIRDNKLYEGRADTFNEYLSYHDCRDDARKCINLYEFYIIEHGLLATDIHDIHHKRLLEVIPAIQLQPDTLLDWLERCRKWSWKDLINGVRKVKGRKPLPKEATPPAPLDSHPSPYNKEWVKQQRCLEWNCSASPPSHPHHWPRTKGAGGKYMIPLCPFHHALYQDQPNMVLSTKQNCKSYGNYVAKSILDKGE
jgi:hypothetical protein